jgi:hypothetical protein
MVGFDNFWDVDRTCVRLLFDPAFHDAAVKTSLLVPECIQIALLYASATAA